MSIIQDGHGNGYSAQVDDHGRLYVNANIVSHAQHHSTYHKTLFSMTGETTLQGTSETPIFLHTNTHINKEYDFFNLCVTPDANLEVNVYVGGEYTSGGEGVTPVNMFVGNGKTVISDIYTGGASGDLVVDGSLAALATSFFVPAYAGRQLDFEGGLILPPQKTIYITATGAANDRVRFCALFSRHDEGTVL